MALDRLLAWCVANVGEEALSAAVWEGGRLALPDRNARARRMLDEVSAKVVAVGHPREFVRTLPGVGPAMRTEAAYLVFRMVQSHLYVAAAQGHRMKDREWDCLLLMALALGLADPPLRKGSARDILTAAFPGGRREAEARVEAELDARVHRLETLPRAALGASEFLTLALSVDLATGWFDDLRLSAGELARLRTRAADRAASVMSLIRLTARADGEVTPEEEAVLAAIAEALPTLGGPPSRLSVEGLPGLLGSSEERHGLLRCMVAVATADGEWGSEEERLCRTVAELLGLPPHVVDCWVPQPLPA